MLRDFFRGEKHAQQWRVITFLPIGIPTALAIFSIVTIVWLLLNQFNGWYVWPTATLAALAGSWVIYKKYPHAKIHSLEEKVCTLLVLTGVVLWAGFNGFYTSQHVHTDRDPATYAVAAIWLSNHDSLQIPQEHPLGIDRKHFAESSAGFGIKDTNALYAQGAHLFPALMGLVGKVTSPSIMLHVNPVFGGVALLAVYAFARLLVRQRWALIAVAAVAVCLPMINFSRDSYTEPLALALTFTAMTLLALAYQTKKRIVWAIAGMAAGAGQLVRVDAALSIIGITIAVFAIMIMAERKDKMKTLVNATIFLILMLGVMLLGILDVKLLSSGYYHSLSGEIKLELLAIAGVVVTGIVATVISWKTKLIAFLDKKTTAWRGTAMAVIVGGICLVLASRPLWMVGKSHVDRGLIEGLQVAAGVPVDGFRNYTELTINWVSWYMGLPLVVFAFFGALILAYRAVKNKNLVWLLAFVVIFANAFVYLIKPSITADQIWASRRLLPVILPGVAILGAIIFEWIWDRKKLPWRLNGPVIASSAATLAIIVPFMIMSPFLRVQTYNPMLDQTQATCDDLPKNAVLIWVGTARLNMPQPTRSLCGVASIGLLDDGAVHDKKLMAKLAKKARANGYEPIIGVYGSQFNLIPEKYASGMHETSAIVYQIYNHHLLQAPRDIINGNRSILIGEITSKGGIKPVQEVTK